MRIVPDTVNIVAKRSAPRLARAVGGGRIVYYEVAAARREPGASGANVARGKGFEAKSPLRCGQVTCYGQHIVGSVGVG